MSSVIKSERVRLEVAPRRSRTESACEKSARLVHVDGVARAIEVRCSCGELTLLELEYPAETNPAPGPATDPTVEPAS